MIPFDIAFNPSFSENFTYQFVDYTIDSLFVIDILVNLRTAVLDF